jgi:hypothetical protein
MGGHGGGHGGGPGPHALTPSVPPPRPPFPAPFHRVAPRAQVAAGGGRVPQCRVCGGVHHAAVAARGQLARRRYAPCPCRRGCTPANGRHQCATLLTAGSAPFASVPRAIQGSSAWATAPPVCPTAPAFTWSWTASTRPLSSRIHAQVPRPAVAARVLCDALSPRAACTPGW